MRPMALMGVDLDLFVVMEQSYHLVDQSHIHLLVLRLSYFYFLMPQKN